ncbi:MAG: hypothetical protein CH6_1053 [Candidatus Kapaibacterium sp.]|nr:MAG: hypothetical protein CH6_1053 [Candidatus Kapabacteria bacterium]
MNFFRSSALGLEPTYKELKQSNIIFDIFDYVGLEPTYKELKQ